MARPLDRQPANRGHPDHDGPFLNDNNLGPIRRDGLSERRKPLEIKGSFNFN
jgi:hypothetical protein